MWTDTPDPLPAGMLDQLDMTRSVEFVHEVVLAQQPAVRNEALARLSAGANIHVDTFDEHGFTRLAFTRSDGALVVAGRAHWRTFLPDADDLGMHALPEAELE
jgi:hypothetical protein